MFAAGLAACASPGWANQPAIGGVGKVVIGFGAGSVFDIMGRHFADRLQGAYANTVIVENRPGAAGRIAIEHIKRAGVDGQSIIFVPSPLLTLYPHLYAKLGYDPVNDLVALGTVFQTKCGLVVGRNVPASVTNVAQFGEWARARGKLNYTANAEGATSHLLALRMNKVLGIQDAAYVAYNASSSAASLPALIAGDLDYAMWNSGTTTAALKTGQARLLACGAPTRSRFFPNVPTFIEQGFPTIADIEGGGFYAAKGAPEAIRQRVAAAIKTIAQDPATAEMMGRFSVEAAYRSPEDAHKDLVADLARYKTVVQESGVRLDR
jgi:tripartite-type tricarboxylate transporter receptor subunit TctC